MTNKNWFSGFLTRSHINWAVHPQKKVRSLKFQVLEEEGLYCHRSENKGADNCTADVSLCVFVFAQAKCTGCPKKHDTFQDQLNFKLV